MQIQFEPNLNLLKIFKSEVMLLNNQADSENGISLIQPGGDGPPIHTHPFQEERFKVLQGYLEVYKKNRWHKLTAGEEIIIPKKTAHTFRSRDTEECYFEYSVTPKGNFTGMLQTFEKLTEEGKLKSTSDLKSNIYLSMVFDKHSAEIKSVSPPHFVIKTMATVGKILGFQV